MDLGFFSQPVFGVPVSGRLSKNGFRIFFPGGLQCPGLPKTPKFPISDFCHSVDWSETKRAGCNHYLFVIPPTPHQTQLTRSS